MYINFKYLKEKGIPYEWVLHLQVLAQSRVEDLESVVENLHLSETFKQEYTTTIKSGKLRLSEKGKELLSNLQIPDLTDNDVILANMLIKKYVEDGKITCSKNKAARLIAWFRSETNLTHKELLQLINDYFASPEGEYNKKLEYLFFKPENAYEKPNLQSSRLFLFLEKVLYEKSN